MQKQQGACAFSNSCIVPGPRERMPGTNREFCHVHLVAMTMPAAQASNSGSEFARSAFHAPSSTVGRRRSAWIAMAYGVGLL